MIRSLLLALCLSTTAAFAADPAALDPTAKLAQMRKVADSIRPQSGDVMLRGGIAKISLPPTLKFLDAGDAEKVLSELWHNPKHDAILGMLVPTGFDPLESDAWVVVISFEEDGYVKDDDATTIDYAKLMQQMKEGMKEANKERVKQGYPAIEIVGWATPPRYDAQAKKMYWAKELEFGREKQHTLNYNIRMLGRRGVLVLNAVGDMSQLKTIERATPDILKAVNFQEGHRYADFNSSTDKTATYGLAALVAGGIAVKTGLLKMLWVGIIALKKFIIIAVVAIGAAVKRFLAWLTNRKAAAAAAASEPSDTPAPPAS